MPTLKEYLEEQRREGETPYFTNIPGEGPEGAFRYGEEEFTAETERMLEDPGGGFTYTENLPEGLVPRERPQLPTPEKPTAETVAPGGEIPEAYRKEHGLSAEAKWAIDQKIPETAAAVPKKPTEQELSQDFKDRGRFRDHVAKKIEGRLGVDPLTYDYVAEAEKKTKEKEPDLFRAFWGGKKAYHMKDLLNPQEKNMWESALQDFAAKNESETKFKSDQANKELTFGMKTFDDRRREKAKLPTAVKDAIGSMYTDEEGKRDIPGDVLSNAIMVTGQMVDKGMSGPEAVAKFTQAHMQQQIQQQSKRAAIDDALSGIPDPGRWKSAADKAAAKTAAQSALDAGGTEDEVKNRLLDRGWDEKDIAKILLAGPIASADVSRETAKGIAKLDSPDAIRKAWKAGDFGPSESKEARAKAKELLTPFHKG